MPYNLSPQQFAALGQALTQPPPSSIAPNTMNEGTLLAAQSGLLGGAGRFIDQLARQQQYANQEALSAQAADEIRTIPPLSKDYYDRLSQVQAKYGPVFASRPVQQVIGFGESQRKEAESIAEEQSKLLDKTQKATVQQAIRNSTPEERRQLREANPVLASELASDLDNQDKREFEAAMIADTVPEHVLEGVDRKDPLAVKKVASQFRNSLPPALQKIQDLPTMREAVTLADEYKTINERSKANANKATPEDMARMGEIMGQFDAMGIKLDDPSVLAAHKSKFIGAPAKKSPNAYDPRVRTAIEGLD